jgi:hypothetical protein
VAAWAATEVPPIRPESAAVRSNAFSLFFIDDLAGGLRRIIFRGCLEMQPRVNPIRKYSLFRTLGAKTCAKGYKEIPTSGYENLLSRPGAPANRSLVRGVEVRGPREPVFGSWGGSSFRWMYGFRYKSDCRLLTNHLL